MNYKGAFFAIFFVISKMMTASRFFQKGLTFLILILGAISFCTGQSLIHQPPPNDLCIEAIEMTAGMTLIDQNNEFSTVGPPGPVPHDEPITCIESYENDMWYKFTTVQGIPFYEIIITTNHCNTPAGLQAILIKSKDCVVDHFDYKACANKETTDTIAMFLHDPEPGVNYFIYVDGFDGTFCNFNISLLANKNQKLNPTDFVRMRWDYELPEEPNFFPPSTHHEYINNAFTLRWTASPEEDIDFFLIEQVDVGIDPDRARIQGIVESKSTVAGGEEEYVFTDFAGIRGNGQYCYKIVEVLSTGERRYSESYCFEAYIITAFYVGEVKKTDQKGIYSVAYMNHGKKVDYSVQVIDSKRKIVKEMKLENEPIRDGTVTIDMNAFPPGKYFFLMTNSVEMFRREFVVTGE